MSRHEMTTKARVVDYVKRHPSASRQDIADALGLSRPRVREALYHAGIAHLVTDNRKPMTRITVDIMEVIEREGSATPLSVAEKLSHLNKNSLSIALKRLWERGVLTRHRVKSGRPDHPYVWCYEMAKTTRVDAASHDPALPWVHPIRARFLGLTVSSAPQPPVVVALDPTVLPMRRAA